MSGVLMRAGLLATLAALLPGTAQAHIIASRLGDFYAGAVHPLTGLEDVILWATLGLLAATQPARDARWVVLAFPAGLLVGFVAGLQAGVPAGPVVDAALMVALGALLAAAARVPGPALFALTAALGAWRGAANAAGVSPETNTVLFGAGLVLAGYAAITLVSAVVLAFHQPSRQPGQGWRAVTVRAAGSWVAAIGLMVGGFALRGA